MKHVGRLLGYVLLSVNALLVGLMILTAYSPAIHPAVHPVQSCLGMTFPIFLLLNVFFMLFWLVVKYKYALLSLLGMLCCYQQIRLYVPLNSRVNEQPEETIKFLSYNVMGFDACAKENGTNPIVEYIRNSRADIVCVQEYAVGWSKKQFRQKDLDKALKPIYPYQNVQVMGKEQGGTQLACFSKFPILSAERIHYTSRSNGSVMYQLSVGGDTLTVINNHLESNKLTADDKKVYMEMIEHPTETEQVKAGSRHLLRKLAEASAIRSWQADTIARKIAEGNYTYLLVCGDFNDTPISYAHHTIADGLDDAYQESGCGPGISYHENHFYFRIDNILHSKNLRSYNCTVDDSIKDSDHYPIWCYIGKK